MPIPAVMFRKELVSRYGAFYDGPFPEDYEFLLRWMAAGVRMDKVPEDVLIWERSAFAPDPQRPALRSRRLLPDQVGVSGRLAARARHRERFGGRRRSGDPAPGAHARGARCEPSSAGSRVDPDKIGQRASGRPVCSWHDLGAPDGEFLLSYVGNRGAGERIAPGACRPGLEEWRTLSAGRLRAGITLSPLEVKMDLIKFAAEMEQVLRKVASEFEPVSEPTEDGALLGLRVGRGRQRFPLPGIQPGHPGCAHGDRFLCPWAPSRRFPGRISWTC